MGRLSSGTITSRSRGRTRGSMSRCGKCCHYCRQVLTFFVSHIGLCTLLLGYAIAGAFLFQWLESEHEQRMPYEVFQLRANIVARLSQMTTNMSVLIDSQWMVSATDIVNDFEQQLMHAVKYKGYNGNDKLTPTNSQWSFSGSLLYSIIVFTTIGYGNVAPRTDLGKVITILYAIIGIPLMLFCLSNIGHALARMFKFVYFRCCCALCAKPRGLQHRERRKRMLQRRQRHRAILEYNLAKIGEQHWAENGNGNGTAEVINKEPVSCNGQVGGKPLALLIPNATTTPRSSSLSPRNLSPSPFNQSPIDGSSQTSSSSFQEEGNESRQTTATAATTTTTTEETKKRKRKTNVVTRKVSQIFSSKPAADRTKSVPSTPQDVQSQGDRSRGGGGGKQLSRSSSARYHHERRGNPVANADYARREQQQHGPHEQSGLNIIANKYASYSDECIDVHVGEMIEPAKTPSTTPITPPPVSPLTPILNSTTTTTKVRRQHSQVRFQAPGDVFEPAANGHPDRTLPAHRKFSVDGLDSQNAQFTFVPNSANYLPPATPSPALLPPVYNQGGGPSRSEKLDPILMDHIGSAIKKSDLIDYILSANESMLNSDDDDDEYGDNVTQKNIPITVCLALVFGYICGGAMFFSASEDWSFLDAFYFCFITLSTIGFGDLVPGRTVLNETPEESHMTLAICALYLLFGMALLAMSLNLVKEKVIEMVRVVGLRIGILVADDYDDDEEDI